MELNEAFVAKDSVDLTGGDNPLQYNYPVRPNRRYSQLVFLEEMPSLEAIQSSIPLAVEHPSGVVVECNEVFWDMTAGSGPEVVAGEQLEAAHPLLESREPVSQSLAQESFSGFSGAEVGSLSEHLQQIQDLVIELKRKVSEQMSREKLKSGIQGESQRSPIVTRSRGAVEKLPSVQPSTIEYRRRGKAVRDRVKQD